MPVSPVRRASVVLACALLLGACADTREPRQAASSDPVPAGLASRGELGSLDFANSGSDAAQEPFLRGLAALHSFWYEEAVAQFRRAQEIDRDFAMAYWGEALAHTRFLWNREDVDAARTALGRLAPTVAERAAKAPTARERDYLGTVEALYGAGDRVKRYVAFAEAMEDLAGRYPDDEDAVALHALTLQLVTRPFERNHRRIRSAALLEELVDQHPRHPGVLHYLLHAYDDPVLAPLGLRAASIYAEVAPAAHHARHMPSHIFLQLGLWDRVAASNEDAFQVSVDWADQNGLDASRHDFHSLSWLGYAYLQQGRYGETEDALETLARAPRAAGSDSVVAHSHEMGPEQNLHELTGRYLIETRRWSTPAMDPGSTGRLLDASLGGTNATLVLAVALGAAELGEAPRAREAAALLAELRQKEEQRGNQELAARTAIMERQAAGMLAFRQGQVDEALRLLQEAVGIESRMPLPSGPPHPAKPAQELLAEVLLRLGRPDDAAQLFELALLRTPKRALSLLGAARAAAALGDEVSARAHYGELLEVWSGADASVEGLSEARSFSDS